jgi:hypothetical protein
MSIKTRDPNYCVLLTGPCFGPRKEKKVRDTGDNLQAAPVKDVLLNITTPKVCFQKASKPYANDVTHAERTCLQKAEGYNWKKTTSAVLDTCFRFNTSSGGHRAVKSKWFPSPVSRRANRSLHTRTRKGH